MGWAKRRLGTAARTSSKRSAASRPSLLAGEGVDEQLRDRADEESWIVGACESVQIMK